MDKEELEELLDTELKIFVEGLKRRGFPIKAVNFDPTTLTANFEVKNVSS